MPEISDILAGLGEFISPPDPPASDFMMHTDPVMAVKAERAMRVLWFWRVKVSVMIAIILLSMALMLTPSGFVRATDLDQKIVDAVKPIKTEQATIAGKLEVLSQQTSAMQEALNELLATNVANNICRMLRRMGDEKDYNERRQTREETDVLQRRYKSLMGEDYPEQRCKE